MASHCCLLVEIDCKGVEKWGVSVGFGSITDIVDNLCGNMKLTSLSAGGFSLQIIVY